MTLTMKIKTLLLFVLLLTSSFLMAQRDLTMEEAVLRTTSNGQSLSPATLAQFLGCLLAMPTAM